MAWEIRPELQLECEVLGKCCPSRMHGLGLDFKYHQSGAGRSTKVIEEGVRVTSAAALCCGEV